VVTRVEFRCSGLEILVSQFGSRDSDLGMRVSGLGFRVPGFGLRVSGVDLVAESAAGMPRRSERPGLALGTPGKTVRRAFLHVPEQKSSENCQ